MPAQAGPTPFLFGKLPAHGDFVSRGLSEPEREAWDAWASEAMQALRDRCGESFEDAHDAAPPWRFVAGPSQLGAGWRAGALAPSVDSAGRRFILVMGVQGWTASQAAVFGFAAASALEGLVYRAVAQASSADAALTTIQSHLEACDEVSLRAAQRLDVQPRGPAVWWTLDAAEDSVFGQEVPPPGMLAATALQQLRETA